MQFSSHNKGYKESYQKAVSAMFTLIEIFIFIFTLLEFQPTLSLKTFKVLIISLSVTEKT